MSDDIKTSFKRSSLHDPLLNPRSSIEDLDDAFQDSIFVDLNDRESNLQGSRGYVNIQDDDVFLDNSQFRSDFDFDQPSPPEEEEDYFRDSLKNLREAIAINSSELSWGFSGSSANTTPTNWTKRVPPTNEELDKWIGLVYRYYLGGGYWNMLLSQFIELIVLTFFVLFVVWIFTCIDYAILLNPIPPGQVEHFSTVIRWDWLKNMNAYFIIVLVIYSIFLIWKVLKLIISAKTYKHIHTYFRDELLISDFQLRTMRWTNIVKRINETNNAKGLDRMPMHHAAARILKRENFMIALFNNHLLDIAILKVSPGRRNSCASKLRQFEIFRKGIKIFSHSIVRCIEYGILNMVFDDRSNVREEFLNDDEFTRNLLISQLVRRFRIMSVVNLLLLPVIVIFVPIYTVFQYGEEIYKNPSTLSLREWSIASKWKYREYNELSHLFRERMRLAGHYAKQYLEQFPYGEIESFARLGSFLASSFVMFWLVITVFNDTILFGLEVTSTKTVFWWIGALSAAWAICNSIVSHKTIYFPEYKLKKMEKWVHRIPEKYSKNPNSRESLKFVKTHYQLRLQQFLNEFVGILIGPYVLWKSLPECAPRIVDFIRNSTIEHSKLGKVCRYSVFDEIDEEDYTSNIGSLIDFGETVKQMPQSVPQGGVVVGQGPSRRGIGNDIEMGTIGRAHINEDEFKTQRKLDQSIAYFQDTTREGRGDVDMFYRDESYDVEDEKKTSNSGRKSTEELLEQEGNTTGQKPALEPTPHHNNLLESYMLAEPLEEIQQHSKGTEFTLLDHLPKKK